MAEDKWVEVPDTRPRNDLGLDGDLVLTPDPDEPPTSRDMIPVASGLEAVPLADRNLEALPGQNALKPVIRETATGRLVAGSGRYPMANNPASVGAAAAWKRSKSAREALEKAIPFEDPEARFSLERLIEDAFDAAEGSPQQVRCPHCGKQGVVAFKKDGQLIFKLMELIVGAAPKTVEVKTTLDVRLQQVMSERTVVPTVVTMSREDYEARQVSLLAKGVLSEDWLGEDAQYREVDPSEKVEMPE